MRRNPAANPGRAAGERVTRKPTQKRTGQSALDVPSVTAKSPSVTLIGTGNWGTALALALHDAEIPLREIVTRRKSHSHHSLARAAGGHMTTLPDAKLDADVLWICTPDAVISKIAADLGARLSAKAAAARLRSPKTNARRIPPIVFHSSGALGSSELAVLRTVEASVASVHPLMTFPQPSIPQKNRPERQLASVPFAIEGDPRACRAARKLVQALGGEAFALSARNKTLYHAFGAFISPLLVAVLTAATETAAAAGYTPVQARRRMQLIIERTLANFFAAGPQKSFSGPIARGDVATIARHLDALRPHPRLEALYRELSRYALHSLPSRNRRQIQRLLYKPPDSPANNSASRTRSRASTA